MPLPLSSDDIIGSTSSRRGWSRGMLPRTATDVFRRYSDDDDEEEGNLKWAVLEKLPTYDRMRKGNLRKEVENGKIGSVEIDSQNPGVSERKLLVEKILKVVEVDNEHFLPRLKSRIDQAGPELPMVEVRFEDLCVEADACVTERHIEYHKGECRNGVHCPAECYLYVDFVPDVWIWLGGREVLLVPLILLYVLYLHTVWYHGGCTHISSWSLFAGFMVPRPVETWPAILPER
ncbi:uncharacterized protein A4U43_C04F6250 [Asparagus officinalis]|uniref:ABC-transporter N-terminal domain-containing protein n=1 Tax=Asparagus officinalis TaxID=4686 RepID=A0A5P1EZ53_ASPOF|nr:uncharacterized protein A4U43_C04F6250 [Asparagus officinalis]